MSQRYAGGIVTANQNANFSGLFSGLNSWLSFPGAAQYAIATSTTPFTIEAWVKSYTAGGLIFSEEFTSGAINIVCSLATSNAVEVPSGLFPTFGWYNGTSWTTAAASTIPIALNTWTHIAFVFTGSTSKIYINGVDVTKINSPTPAITWGVTAANGTNWFIGRRWDQTGANIYYDGLINNFRFVNGTAVYTSNFTVPTNLTAITNTVMLTCNRPTFIDGSSYAATITNNNGVIIGTDNPFYTQPSPALGAATPGVWTLSQANQAAGQRSWPMYDPRFNLVTSMIHGNGTNGATNNTFLDSSTNNFSVTRNGNTTQGTFTPFSQPSGYWSNYFGSTTGYISAGTNTAFAFGTGDFTLEAWIYMSVLPAGSAGNIICAHNWTGAAINFAFRVNATTGFLAYYDSASTGVLSTTPIPTAVWTHVACVRSSGVITLYRNGVSIGSGTLATTVTSTVPLTIGHATGGGSFGYFTGYISNARIVKGTALYTAAFTPSPLPLTAVANTSLLTCQNNRFIDNSTNNFALTSFGDSRTIGFSPFYPPTAYLPQNNGGAMYFDATGDYLDLTGSSNLAFGEGDWTIELWYYTLTVASDRIIYDSRPASTQGAYPTIYQSGTSLFFLANSTNLITSSGTIATGTWYHILVSKVSGQTRMFLNGVQQGSTYTDSINYLNGASRPRIGDGGVTAGSGVSGYISNLRVLKGTGVTSVTVPTTPLTAITNTQLLLSGTNAAVFDNAANVVAETNVASISTAQNKYGSGSMSFNGSTTYIRLTNPFGSGANLIQTLGDFTVEAWINPTTVTAQQTIFCINGNTTGFAGCRLDINTTGGIQLLVSTSGAAHAINSASAIATPTGVWTHVAVVRQGPSFIVYFNGSPVITSTTVTITTAVVAGTVSSLGAVFNSSFGGFFNGYINDFRTTNYARYLGVFTPPTSTLQNQ
jgi:hypothetical protein